MTHEPAYSDYASYFLAKIWLSLSLILIFVPSGRDLARFRMRQALKSVDILKVNEEEARFLAGTSDLELSAKISFPELLLSLIALTLGKRGCLIVRG